MYVVYDRYAREWAKEEFYISPNEEVFVVDKNIFGFKKLVSTTKRRYVCKRDIGIRDKNDQLIFEGDFLRSDEYDIEGVVAYAPQQAAYLLFDEKTSTYYPLGEEICKHVEIIFTI